MLREICNICMHDIYRYRYRYMKTLLFHWAVPHSLSFEQNFYDFCKRKLSWKKVLFYHFRVITTLSLFPGSLSDFYVSSQLSVSIESETIKYKLEIRSCELECESTLLSTVSILPIINFRITCGPICLVNFYLKKASATG